jgi:hypothetical protein
MIESSEILSVEDRQRETAAPRVRVSWKVRAITSTSESFVTCVVQDVSSGGARLSVPIDAELPDQFRLHFPLRDITHDVQVRWRGTGEIGVAFVDSSNSTPIESDIAGSEAPSLPEDLSTRVMRLEVEIANLKSIVAQLKSP